MKTLKLLYIILFLLSGHISQSQDIPVFISDSLDVYVERAMKSSEIPGVAVLVLKDGIEVVKKGYGIRKLGEESIVDENTLFMIGSNTKAFTATAVAILEEQGKWTLEDPVKQHVPDFSMSDKWVEEHSTLTDILSHQMGYRTFQGDFMMFDSNLSSEEIMSKMGKLTPEHKFRTNWGYYNTGFMIAGMAIENVTGKEWAKYIEDEIFIPLQMEQSIALSADMPKASNRAAAHSYVDGKMSVIEYGMIDQAAPAGSISSSISDMSHWVRAQLDNGKWAGEQIIPSTVISRTRKAESIVSQSSHPFNKSNFQLYGLGWALQDYEGAQIVSHTGGIHGFVTSVTLVPDKNLGIVILTNTDQNAFFEALKWEIVDAYMDLPYRGYASLYSNYMKQRRMAEEKRELELADSTKLKIPPSLKLKDFEGTYRHFAYGTVELSKDGNDMILSFSHHPDLRGTLKHLSGNRFYCDFNIPLYGYSVLPFDVSNGKVGGFRLKVPDFIEYTSYYFEKD